MFANKLAVRLFAAAILAASVYLGTSLDMYPRFAAAVIVGLPSLVLMVLSRRQLGNSFTVMPAASVLVTTRVYARVMHPMYLYLDLVLASLVVISGMPVLLAGWGMIVILQILQSRREEYVLAAAFGAAYDTYRRQAWF